ncbi:MAG: amino acid adenylation domain-containing protein [Thermodesulfobacteriota bacterium]
MYTYNLGIKFEEIAERYAHKAALKFSWDNTLSYRELNSKANQVARYLQDNGLRRNDVVCISGEKRLFTFACMLACLKLGVIYSIMDPDSPVERLRKILSTCMPKVFFAGEELCNQLKTVCTEIRFEALDNKGGIPDKALKGYSEDNLSVTGSITGTNPAYIMFTSGSTGFPKGALMTHDNVMNFIGWSIENFNFTSGDILTNVNPLYFDNTVFDFYSALFAGASLVPFSKETVTNPKELISMVDELKCTSWFSVPSLLIFLQTMKALDKNNMVSLRQFIFGGEGYPKAKLKGLFDMYSNRSEIINVYGPTECTCMCSAYRISASDFDDLIGFPPLGKIADNFSYLILDDAGKKVSDNTTGELCLMGPNVGKGYYNDPVRTKDSFIQNPYNSNFSEVIYKTGDLVFYNPEDKKIHIVGRKDHQIKHMGYRIELEEIETALNSLDYISSAAVIHGDIRGLSHIIAVVCTAEEKHEKEIREDLKQIVPHYMIPTNFHFECSLPKNQNGKIDRKKLSERYFTSNI